MPTRWVTLYVHHRVMIGWPSCVITLQPSDHREVVVKNCWHDKEGELQGVPSILRRRIFLAVALSGKIQIKQTSTSRHDTL